MIITIFSACEIRYKLDNHNAIFSNETPEVEALFSRRFEWNFRISRRASIYEVLSIVPNFTSTKEYSWLSYQNVQILASNYLRIKFFQNLVIKMSQEFKVTTKEKINSRNALNNKNLAICYHDSEIIPKMETTWHRKCKWTFPHLKRRHFYLFGKSKKKKTFLKKTCKLRELNVAISQKTNCCGKKKSRDNYFAFFSW